MRTLSALSSRRIIFKAHRLQSVEEIGAIGIDLYIAFEDFLSQNRMMLCVSFRSEGFQRINSLSCLLDFLTLPALIHLFVSFFCSLFVCVFVDVLLPCTTLKGYLINLDDHAL